MYVIRVIVIQLDSCTEMIIHARYEEIVSILQLAIPDLSFDRVTIRSFFMFLFFFTYFLCNGYKINKLYNL